MVRISYLERTRYDNMTLKIMCIVKKLIIVKTELCAFG